MDTQQMNQGVRRPHHDEYLERDRRGFLAEAV
ncbi:hypothetical protein PRIO_5260 [Paenibacillus riograndensis SBR5]|uniref:Uncharacterized protein n=1 Tax=Paenibacillus riograndensis SBR5 TaxID=1073571 RepID=A0A0E4HGQ4_9BACL|nr:hypothetical protein PRIO_5260 [Paenibacillus riograndensis SBR5]